MAHIDDQGTQRSNLDTSGPRWRSRCWNVNTKPNLPENGRTKAMNAHAWTNQILYQIGYCGGNKYKIMASLWATWFKKVILASGAKNQQIWTRTWSAFFNLCRMVDRASIQDYILQLVDRAHRTTSAQKSLFFNLRRLRTKIDGRPLNIWLTAEGREKFRKSPCPHQRCWKREAAWVAGINHSTPLYPKTAMMTSNLLPDHQTKPKEIVIGIKDSARSAWLNSALKTLSDREQRIIRERHLQYDTVTLEDLGKKNWALAKNACVNSKPAPCKNSNKIWNPE